jgi:dTDP-4-dehydrorhamnose reductase
MVQQKNILITGSNGLLGQSLLKSFSGKYVLSGCDLSDESYNMNDLFNTYYQLDITQRDQIQRFFAEHKPEIIINTAAYTDVDRSEEQRDICWAANVRGVELIIEAVEEYSPVFVQISTDYVFDGKSGLYRETDKTNPISYYGHTKLAAEKIVRSSGLEYIIARSMILYGVGQKIRNNFVLWLIEQLKREKKVQVVSDQTGNPTLVDDLSESIYRLLKSREYGVFHIAGSEICTRLAFARRIAKVFKLDDTLIQEISSDQLKQKALRPINSTFNLNKLSNVLDWLPGGLDESLKKLKSQLE